MEKSLLTTYNPDMQLTADQVQHVAKLAKLPLSENEVEKYSSQLSEILDYVEKLNGAKTEGIEPTFNVTGLFNVMREDQDDQFFSQDSALQNAPVEKDGFFVTKGVFEEG